MKSTKTTERFARYLIRNHDKQFIRDLVKRHDKEDQRKLNAALIAQDKRLASMNDQDKRALEVQDDIDSRVDLVSAR